MNFYGDVEMGGDGGGGQGEYAVIVTISFHL